jgi:hypothetical protein
VFEWLHVNQPDKALMHGFPAAIAMQKWFVMNYREI